MSDNDSIWSAIGRLVELYFRPLREAAARGDAGVTALLEDAVGPSSDARFTALSTLADAVAAFSGNVANASSPADVGSATAPLLAALEDAARVLVDDAGALFEYLTVQFLWNVNPRAYAILSL